MICTYAYYDSYKHIHTYIHTHTQTQYRVKTVAAREITVAGVDVPPV